MKTNHDGYMDGKPPWEYEKEEDNSLVHKNCGGRVVRSDVRNTLNGYESKCVKCGAKWWSCNDCQCTVLKSEYF